MQNGEFFIPYNILKKYCSNRDNPEIEQAVEMKMIKQG